MELNNIKITKIAPDYFEINGEIGDKKLFNYTSEKNLMCQLEKWFTLVRNGDYSLIRGEGLEEYQLTDVTTRCWYIAKMWSLDYVESPYVEIIVVKNNEIKLSFNDETDSYYIDKEYSKEFNATTK